MPTNVLFLKVHNHFDPVVADTKALWLEPGDSGLKILLKV